MEQIKCLAKNQEAVNSLLHSLVLTFMHPNIYSVQKCIKKGKNTTENNVFSFLQSFLRRNFIRKSCNIASNVEALYVAFFLTELLRSKQYFFLYKGACNNI